MNINVDWPAPGRYILAVSGGADSMAMLDLFAANASARSYELVVAHFDHGIRADSRVDLKLVEEAAGRLGLSFESHEAHLGKTSEAKARAARHAWLELIRRKHEAAAIITAHHEDDVIETSLLNLARGSGRRGIAPMRSGSILRPLLGVSRKALRDYARTRQIQWREDPTNADTGNPRNFLRHKLLPAASPKWRARYLELVDEAAKLNKKIAQSISAILESALISENVYSFSPEVVRGLSLDELAEVIMAAALCLRPDVELDRRLVDEIALFAKTASPGRRRALRNGLEVAVSYRSVQVLALLPVTNASS